MGRSLRWHERLNDGLGQTLGIRVVRQRTWPVGRVRPPGDPRVDRLLREPVFVLSSVRSGSTLLRVVLNSNSQIHAPHETHFRRLEVTPSTSPSRMALDVMELNVRDTEHLLWDRLLHRELARSGKRILVEKTPSNVFIADRLATAWPDARFIFLLRHPASVAQSWHEGMPQVRPMGLAVQHTLNFMEHVEKARASLSGHFPSLTLRYEDLTGSPREQTERLCDFLGVPWEPAMLSYGAADHGDFTMGIGDWKDKIRTGTIQPGRPLPDESQVPGELRQMCRIWGY